MKTHLMKKNGLPLCKKPFVKKQYLAKDIEEVDCKKCKDIFGEKARQSEIERQLRFENAFLKSENKKLLMFIDWIAKADKDFNSIDYVVPHVVEECKKFVDNFGRQI